jgi:hypothetical protein
MPRVYHLHVLEAVGLEVIQSITVGEGVGLERYHLPHAPQIEADGGISNEGPMASTLGLR